MKKGEIETKTETERSNHDYKNDIHIHIRERTIPGWNEGSGVGAKGRGAMEEQRHLRDFRALRGVR